MKKEKITVIFFALFMVLSFGACNGNDEPSKDNAADTVIDTDEEKQEAEETGEVEETSEAGDTEDGAKVLVAYFSAFLWFEYRRLEFE